MTTKSRTEVPPLIAWLKKHQIIGVMFDFDDTLIKTTEIFSSAIQEVLQMYVIALPGLSHDEAYTIFKQIDEAVHLVHAVNPNRWKPIIHEFEAELQIQKSRADEALKILASIYKHCPEYEEGAEQVLQLLKQWNFLLGLVTHANAQWTAFKLSSLGLDSFFDHVEIVDENTIHKGELDWTRAASMLQISKKTHSNKHLLAVGDNVHGDVIAAVWAGYGQVVWIDKKNGYHIYRNGEVPRDVIAIPNVGRMLTFGSPAPLLHQ